MKAKLAGLFTRQKSDESLSSNARAEKEAKDRKAQMLEDDKKLKSKMRITADKRNKQIHYQERELL